MNHPDVDLLAALVLGDHVPDEVRSHVDTCPQCRAETDALGGAREVFREPMPALVSPPASLRASVLAAAFADGSSDGSRRQGSVALRDRDAAAPSPAQAEPVRLDDARRRRRFGAAWLAGAAAAGIVVGAATVSVLDGDPEPTPGPSRTVIAQASLDTLDTKQKVGSADLVETSGVADLTVRTDGIEASDGYIEVWLINRDLKRMVSVGVLDTGLRDQTFTVPADLVAQGYVIVDVSREPFDEDARHSGETLMRGELPI